MMKKRQLSRIKTHILIYLGCGIVLVFTLFPLIWMLSTALKPIDEVLVQYPSFIPSRISLHSFKFVLTQGQVGQAFINSCIVAISTTFLALAVTMLAGYSISRFRFVGRKTLAISVILFQMIPGVLMIIPLYQVLKTYHLINTLWALIIADTTFTLPLCIWLLKGFFDSIPVQLDEAAMVDGCSHIGAFFRVVLPISLPGLAVAGIFAFLRGWNELVFAFTFISSTKARTLPAAIISAVAEDYMVRWDYLMATGVIATFPLFILFFLIQRYLISGLTAGALKG